MPRRILIVEDDKLNRMILQRILKKEYDVIEAQNGAEALEVLAREYKELSAVIMDIGMPVMDGFELLRRMRENDDYAPIPALVATGSQEEEMEVKALSLGANDFVKKPYNPALILHCLRNTINLRETASAVNALQRDRLTGLYSREAFYEKTEAMIREQPPGYYIMACFDIDNFKVVNDQYGTAEGDRILRHIGKVIREDVSAIGGVSARISADNFAMLYPAEQKHVDFVTKMRDSRLTPKDSRIAISFSVGRYIITDPTLPANSIYDRAFLAKQSVKGRYDQHIAYYDESMRDKLISEQQLVDDMDAALAQKQFEVWFQPQFNHASGALIGAEALVRWRHPQKGLISPGLFIPVFEQNGFIYELDKFVWEESCRYLRKWMDEGRAPLPLSVNISRYDVFCPDLIDVMLELMRRYSIPADLLHLEITESAFAQSSEQIISVVERLIKHGFTLEIDDFGSGYSSLNTLKDVPANVLKLDMRFLEGTGNSQRGGNILESIVRMAKWLGMVIIAEGVETKEQADFLKSIGCVYVQGYLYARPMPAEEYEALPKGGGKEEHLLALQTVANLDNNAFWDPQSMDTLIFNSFIGGAAIFEYYHGRIELLRANDKFPKVIGGAGMTVEDALQVDWHAHIDEQSRAEMAAALRQSIQTGDELTKEFLFLNLPKCPKEVYLRTTLRVIASVGERYLVYCTNENTTARRQAERELRETDEQLRFLNSTAHDLLAQPDSDKGVESVLWKLLEYFDGNRAYAFEIDDGQGTASNTYEVCAKGVATHKSRLQNMPFEMYGFWQGAFDQQNYIRVDDVDELDDARPEKKLLQSQGVRSCIAVPLRRDGRQIGCIGIDDPRRQQFSVERLSALGDYIAVMLTRRDLNAAIGSERKALQDMMTKAGADASYQQMLPTALAAVMGTSTEISFVKDRELRYVCCSRAFAKLAGLKDERDVIGKTDEDFVGKALARQYAKVDRRILETGQAVLDYDEALPAADGAMRYAKTSKYPLLDAKGKVIGIYGIGRDMTEYRAAFEQLKLLTDSIPGGIASFEISDSGLRMLYFNEGFYSYSGYSREEYAQKSTEKPMFLVFEEDLPAAWAAISAVRQGSGRIDDCTYRCHTKNGGFRWFSMKGTLSGRQGNACVVNAVQFDITEQRAAEERLRMSEEQFRIAAALGDRTVARYDIKTKVYYNDSELLFEQGFGREIPNVPQAFVDGGLVDPVSAPDFAALYQKLEDGAKSATATTLLRMPDGSFRWFRMDATTIFSANGLPSEAIIVFFDVTEQREKEAVYTKWQQSLQERPLDSYTLFRCNLNANASFDSVEGSLLQIKFGTEAATFNMRTMEYVEKYVYPQDRQTYIATLNSDALLANYYRGKRNYTLEYRELVSGDRTRWLRLSVELVEYPDSTDVLAYLMYEDIDEGKRAELQARELAETDPLTGVLNRNAFAAAATRLFDGRKQNSLCALLMFDIDGFKLVNDSFGHAVGDQALIDVAKTLRAILRPGDLVGRLGGDEFLVCLHNVPDRAVIARKAKQICAQVRKSFSIEVQISASLGVALCPDDGGDFETLYHKADLALYHVKANGKDNFCFYSEDMSGEYPKLHDEDGSGAPKTDAQGEPKRRMLIVEDNRLNREILIKIFKDDYLIDTADDGNAALIRLRRYGAGISVVLLDLIMPGMDGFTVLEKMRASAEMSTIPVVVVSGTDERETSLKAIQSGASDFVTKPVNPALIRLRVQSAISKAENERLRAQNSYLALQGNEVARYRAVLENDGIVIAEYDVASDAFYYDPAITQHIAGSFDGRPLWEILLADHVADTEDVREMRELVRAVAEDEAHTSADMTAMLRTPSNIRRPFRVCVIRRVDEFRMGDKLIIAFEAIN